MKICFVNQMPFPYTTGGTGTYIKELSEKLIEKGHEVYVISSKPSENLKQETGKIKSLNVGIKHRKFKGGILSLIYRIFFEISFMLSSFIAVKRIKPDVIHLHSLLAEALPFSLSRTDFVATAHGIHFSGFEKLWQERNNKMVLFLSKFLKPIEEFNARNCKAIICINPSIARYYSRFSKAVYIPNSTNVADFMQGPKAKRRYLALSRLTEQKGLEILLDALSILDSKNIEIEMIIAGDGEKEYVKKLKEKAGKFKNISVKFPGFVYGKEKIKLYASSSVFIMPSIFEPFGITLLEAMASSCAIISSNTEGPKKIVKPNFGILVNYNNKKRAENLAGAIIKSLKWDIPKMGRFAKEEASKYDYEVNIKRFMQIYQSIKK